MTMFPKRMGSFCRFNGNRCLVQFCVGLGMLIAAAPLRGDDAYEFQAPTLDGQTLKVAAGEHALTAVCFLGTECPLARLYSGRLAQLAEQFPEVDFVGAFSNRQDSAVEIRDFLADYPLGFPCFRDVNNRIADLYHAERTPEVVLLDAQLNEVYRGRVDDQYLPGTARSEASRADLRLAIEQALAGQNVSVPKTSAAGCLIGRVARETGDATSVTFANQISRVLNHHCLECHREGEIGPMAFEDYDDVVGWSEMILEVVEQGRMPPWHADANHRPLANARGISEGEKQMIRDWVAAGAPLGDPERLPSRPESTPATKWQMGQVPDLVLPMRERPFQVPADGTVEYQYYVVDPGFEEDRWVIGAEVLPGDRSVLHHSIVFFRPPEESSVKGVRWLTGFVPGQQMPAIDPRYGRRIPAGSKLIFQQHYTPNGKPTADISQLGLVFGNESRIEHELLTLLALNQEFVIHPGDSRKEVSQTFPFLPAEGRLLGIAPHMHYRGKSFHVSVRSGDRREVILNVPHYDFNWQHQYQFQQPMPLDEIDQLEFVATFDNSADNPFNPDPEKLVVWGDQTEEEMAVAFATVAIPRQPKRAPASSAPRPDVDRRSDRAVEFVDRYLEQFDGNRDGLIGPGEVLESMKRFGFRELDQNGDGLLDRDELMVAATRRFSSR